MFVIHSEVTVDPASREQAVDTLREMAVASRAEEGVISYRVTEDLDARNTFRIIEQYEDKAAVEAHESSDHLERFQAIMHQYLADEPELYRFEVSSKEKGTGP